MKNLLAWFKQTFPQFASKARLIEGEGYLHIDIPNGYFDGLMMARPGRLLLHGTETRECYACRAGDLEESKRTLVTYMRSVESATAKLKS